MKLGYFALFDIVKHHWTELSHMLVYTSLSYCCSTPLSILQDVLKASDVELDGMFKLSFAYDIVNVSYAAGVGKTLNQLNYYYEYYSLL